MATNKNVPTFNAPFFSSPKFTAPTFTTPTFEAPSLINDTKVKLIEPRYAHDLGDIILGNPISGTKQLRNTLKKHDMESLELVPVINRTVGFGLMAKDRFLDPLIEGRPAEAVINTLESVGDSMDILANPVKSLMPWAGGGSGEDFLKSMGWVEGDYRETYQWNVNTGNGFLDFAVNLVGETISDPVNWLSFGAKQVVATTVDELEEQLTKRLTIMYGDDVVKQIDPKTIRRMAEHISEDITSENSFIISELKDRLAVSRAKYLNDLTTAVDDDTAKLLTNMIGQYDNALSKTNIENLSDMISNIRYTDGYKKYLSAMQFKNFAETLDKGIAHLSFSINPMLMGTAMAVKHIGGPAFDSIKSAAIKKLRTVTKEEVLKDPEEVIFRLNNLNTSKAMAQHQDIVNKYTLILKDGKSMRDLINVMQDIFNKVDINILANEEELTNLFIKQVIESDLFTTDGVKILQSTDISDLMIFLERTAILNQNNALEIARRYYEQIEAELIMYFDFTNKTLGDRSTLSILKYVDDNATIDGIHYSLDNLYDYIRELRKVNTEEANKIESLVSFLGINNNNYKEVAIKFKEAKDITKASNINKELEDLLINSKRGIYTSLAAENKYIKYYNDLIEFNIKADGTMDAVKNLYTDPTKAQEMLRGLSHTPETIRDINNENIKKAMNSLRAIEESDAVNILKDVNFNKIIRRTYQTSDFKRDVIEPLERLLDFYNRNLIDYEDYNSLNFTEDLELLKRNVYYYRNAIREAIDQSNSNIVDDSISYNFKSYFRDKTNEFLSPASPKNEHIKAHYEQLKAINPNVDMYGPEMQDYLKSEGLYVDDFTVTARLPRTDIAKESSLTIESTLSDLYVELEDLTPYVTVSSEYGVSALTEIQNNMSEILTLEIAKTGTLFLMNKNILASLDEGFINAIIDTESQLTKSFEQFTNTLLTSNDKVLQGYANTLRNTIHKLRMNINMNRIFDANYIDNKNMNQFIVTAIYDTIYNNPNKSEYIVDNVISAFEELYGWELKQYSNFGFDKNTEYLISEYLELDRLIQNSFEELSPEQYLRYEELKTLIDVDDLNKIKEHSLKFENYADFKMQLTTTYNERIKNIRDLIESRFNTYKNLVDSYNNIYKTNLNLWNSFNKLDITYLDSIGNDFETIAYALLNSNFDDIVIEDNLTTLVNLFGDKISKEVIENTFIGSDYATLASNIYGELDEINTNLQKSFNTSIDLMLSSDENALISLDKYKDIMFKYTEHRYAPLNRVIENTFYDIGRINESLQGNPVTLVDSYNGKYVEHIKDVSTYFIKSEVNERLRSINANYNLYNFVLDNGFITFKYVMKDDGILNTDMYKAIKFLAPVNSNLTTNQIAFSFAQILNNTKKIISDYTVYSDVAQVYRDVLRNYTTTSFYTVPVDYFENLSYEDVYLFYYALKYNKIERLDKELDATIDSLDLHNPKLVDRTLGHEVIRPDGTRFNAHTPVNIKSKLYEYENQILYELDLTDKVRTSAILTDEDYTDYLKRSPLAINNYKSMCNTIEGALAEDLQLRIKEPEALLNFKDSISYYVSNNIEQLKNLHILGELQYDETPVLKGRVHGLTDDELKYLKRLGIDETTQVGSQRFQEFQKIARHSSIIESINNWSPKQIRTYIEDNLRNVPSKTLIIDGSQIDLLSKYKQSDFDAVGLQVEKVVFKKEKEEIITYFVSPKDLDMDWKTFKDSDLYEQLVWYKTRGYQLFENYQEPITESFKNNRHTMNFGDVSLPSELYTGDNLNLDLYEYLCKKSKSYDVKQFSYSKKDLDLKNKYLKRNLSLPNTAIIGSNHFIDDLVETTGNKGIQTASGSIKPYVPKRLDLAAYVSSIESIKRIDAKTKYLQLIFNDDFYIGNKTFKTTLENMSDTQLKEFFSKHNYAVTVLKEGRDKQPRVYRIAVRNQKELADAIAQKAVVLPYDVYRNAALSINESLLNSTLMKYYRALIASTYKSIYLASPGFLMRNYLDTAIFKNQTTADGVMDIFDNFKYQHKASQALEWYNKIYAEIIDESGSPNVQKIKQYFISKNMTADEVRAFTEIDVLTRSYGMGSKAKALELYLKDLALEKNNTLDDWAQSFITARDTITSPLFDINSKIEQTNRLALYFKLSDSGLTMSDAISKIADTHFDYEFRTDTMELVNELFWFSTFPINNVAYYINYGLENPDMMKLQMDMLQLSYNDEDDMTWEQVAKSNYLTYNTLAGNIRLNINGKNIVIKTGSSLLDAVNILLNPLDSGLDRLNPWLSAIVNKDISELNPFVSYKSKAQQIVKAIKTGGAEGSFVPSVYATLYDYNSKVYPKYKKGTWNYAHSPKYYYKKPNPAYFKTYRKNYIRYAYTKYSKFILPKYEVALPKVDYKIYNKLKKGVRSIKRPYREKLYTR